MKNTPLKDGSAKNFRKEEAELSEKAMHSSGSNGMEKENGKTTVLPKDTGKIKKSDSDAMTKISPSVKKNKESEDQAPKAPEEEGVKVVKRRKNSTVFAITLTIVYLLFVLAISVGVSIFAIDVMQDAFALNKEGVETEVTLTGDYVTLDDVAQQLYEQKIIRHPTIFKIYARLRHKDTLNFIPCTRTVTTSMGYDGLLTLFTPVAKEKTTISVTVPEGYTVDDIISLFVSKGVGTKEGFLYVINDAPFDSDPFLHNGKTYWFLEGVTLNQGAIYRLEGYLYPDTYFVYDTYKDKEGDIPGTAAAKAVVGKMLAEFNKNIKKSYLTKHREYLQKYYPDVKELSLHEILTLASILEKEGLADERARISAVFYNRLNDPVHDNIGGLLQSNVTVQYVLRHDGYTVTSEFGDFERNYQTPYNTFLYAGLPPGPVSTPTRESIDAALYPAADWDYYYFVTTNSGYSFFARTLAEHKINIERAKNGEIADPYAEYEDLPTEDYNE